MHTINIAGTNITVYVIPDFPTDSNIQDADMITYWDVTAGAMKKCTWANLKAKLAEIHYTKAQIDALLETNDTSSGNFAPYDNAFTYLGGTTYYVSYVDNIYKFISGDNQTGVEPGSDPLVWELVSAGEFVHEPAYTGPIQHKTAGFAVSKDVSLYTFLGADANATFPAMSTLKDRRIRFKNAGLFGTNGKLTFVPSGAEQFLVNGALASGYDLFPGDSVEVAVDEDLTNLMII